MSNSTKKKKMYTISYSCDNCGCSTSKSFNKGTLAPSSVNCTNCGCVAQKVVGEKEVKPWVPPYKKPEDEIWPEPYVKPWFPPDPWDRKRRGPYDKPEKYWIYCRQPGDKIEPVRVTMGDSYAIA